ncbi:ATP-binding cassette domain-containing protein [Allobacillus sp. GCM10007491]|uniref:Phosphate ABC transporter ATP-binding protein n=1 Tax=Allobacillus saliphilus TaxID=2912308 RepID=A0A941CWK4_9BACI|nr:phosphate ABC transporter ATP-binding protein [Allobacillus saliphilus]MBR7553936.1 phosphate ABC transporter ATP-binding protein [Allobacillus saliphilus]
MEPKQAIRFDHVDYTIDDTKILKDINHGFNQGEITTLVGPSGAGKTTLIRLCNGLISPTKGRIYIHDQPIDEYNPVDLRKKVGMVMQGVTMLKGTVRENLAIPLKLQDKTLTDEEASRLLDMVGLPASFLDKNSNSLSGGQKQRISIARSLVNRPSVLLLDEITSSLDTVSQQEVESLIKRINEEYKTTIVWITHNLRQALNIGDYSWVMMDGEVIETGKSEFLNQPNDERVKAFVRSEFQ